MKLITISFLSLILTITLSPVAFAQQDNTNTLTISPAVNNITVSEANPASMFELRINNSTNATRNLKISAVDFGSLDETGGQIIGGKINKNLIETYEPADWVEISQPAITLKPKSETVVPVTIRNLPGLSPGGHYGALVVDVVPGDPEDVQARVELNQSLTSLLFVTKADGATYNLALKNIGNNSSLWELPERIVLNFNNPGNTHVTPRGNVRLLSPAGRVLAEGVINESSGFVLPSQDRQFTVELRRTTRSWLPGQFTLEVDYRYDGISSYAKQTQTFVRIHLLGVGIILLIMAAFASSIWIAVKFIRKKYRKNP